MGSYIYCKCRTAAQARVRCSGDAGDKHAAHGRPASIHKRHSGAQARSCSGGRPRPDALLRGK